MTGGAHFQAGQSLHRALSAGWLNEVDSMLAAWKSGQLATGARPRIEANRQVLVPCQNSDTVDFDIYAPVGIGSFAVPPTTTPDSGSSSALENFKDVPALRCLRHGDSTAPFGRIGITQQPIAAGNSNEGKKPGMGMVCIQGVSVARVKVIDTNHHYANVISGDRLWLQSANYGDFELLAKPSGTGDVWSLVKVGEHHPRPGAWGYGGSAGTVGSSEALITVANRRGFIPQATVTSTRITALSDGIGVGINYGGVVTRATVPSASVAASLVFRLFDSGGVEKQNRTVALATWTPSIPGNQGFGGCYFWTMDTGDYLEMYMKSSTSETFTIGEFAYSLQTMRYASTGDF